MKARKRTITIVIISAVFVAAFLFLRRYASSDRTAGIILVYLILGLLYIFLFAVLRKGRIKLSILMFSILFGTGLACRLILFGLAPQVLSDDIYRYLWDGKVQNAGINPYLYPPDDPRLDVVGKDGDFRLINHPEFPTSYPPLAQHFFRLLYSAAGWNLNLVRLIYLVPDLICFLCIFLLADRKILSFLYFLSPLVIIETFLGLHLDILGVLFMAGTLWFLSRNRYYPAVVCFAASVLTKYVFLAAAPVLVVYYAKTGFTGKSYGTLRKSADIGIKALFFILVLFCVSWPFLKAGPLLFRQLVYYVEYWQFNAPLFGLLRKLFPSYHVLIRAGILAAGGAAISAVRRVGVYDRLRLCMLLLMLLNGAVYPWYLVWLVPFFVFGDRWGELSLVSLIPVSYYVLIGYKASGVWDESRVFMAVQYVPFLLFLIIDIWKGHYVQREEDRGYYPGPQRGAFTSGGSRDHPGIC